MTTSWRKKLSKALFGGAIALSLFAANQRAEAITQLGLIIDVSGSISSSEFNTLRAGAASGVSLLHTDGSVEITVIKFSSTAAVVVAPTVINSAGDLSTIVSTISSMNQSGVGNLTDYKAAFNLMQSTMDFSNTSNKQYINMLTDGNPTDGGTGSQSDPSHEAVGITARDALITAGADLISFEAIGLTVGGSAWNYLLNDLAYPEPGVVAPPFPAPGSNGFVTFVSDFTKVSDALQHKFAALEIGDPPPPVGTTATPEPVTAATGAIGAGLIVVFASRRRRA